MPIAYKIKEFSPGKLKIHSEFLGMLGCPKRHSITFSEKSSKTLVE